MNTSQHLASLGAPSVSERADALGSARQQTPGAPALSAIVCPLTVRELPAALANLRFWNSTAPPSTQLGSGGQGRPRLVYSFNCAPDEGLTQTLVEAFHESEVVRRSFASLEVRFCSLPPEKDVYLREGEVGEAPFGRKAGPNWLFYETMRALRKEARFVFLMETDCEPVTPDWIERIQCICAQNQDAWIIGSHYCGASPLHWSIARHINGNALYNIGDQWFWKFLDDEFWPWLNEYAATSMPDLAYDCAWETYLNRVEMEDASSYEWVRARDILHRFRLSSFVVNIGGAAEQGGEYVWTREEVVKRFPGVAVVHGPVAASLDHRRGPLGVGTPVVRGSARFDDDGLIADGELFKAAFRRSIWIVGRPLDEACTVAVTFTMHSVKAAGVTVTFREPSGRTIGSQRLSGGGFGNPTQERFAHQITTTVPFVRIALTFHGPKDLRVRLSDVMCEITREGELIWRAGPDAGNLIRATGGGERSADDFVSCLSKAVAAAGRPAKIVTLSAAPVANVLAHVFGVDATDMLIVPDTDAPGEVTLVSISETAPRSPLSVDPAKFATIPRFVDAGTLNRLHGAYRPWLMSATAIVLQFQPSPRQIDDLASGGFTKSRQFAVGGRRTVVFLPEQDIARPARDSASIAGRTAPARLVIVDPCLGRAAGHYEAYARMLTGGARDLGLGVVWACHTALDARRAPAGVDVRRCFQRCFFDLDDEQAGAVDLSPELVVGWKSILAEFDDADTHILMHSADAHQLRAAATVFETSPPRRAIVHINFQTCPRFMPGRLAGGDVHAAVLRLRRAPAWERSLFFWAETRRLAAWLSDWLAEEIPAPPFLSDWRGAPSTCGKSGGPITLAFLGEGRPSKGFLDLPDIADHIATRPSLDGALRLAIQNWPPFRGDLARHEAAVVRLARNPFVEIVDGVLDLPAYQALLDDADMLLLPYEPRSYGLQGSGILIEGLARGKIIIARAGTAIIDEARAGVGFAYETAQELAEGLAEIVDDYGSLAPIAVGMAEQFRENNNPRRFVSALAARARGLTWRA